MRSEIDMAIRLIARAGEGALNWSGGLDIAYKADGSPVTALDLELEQILVSGIRREWPDDGIVSEEMGVHPGGSGRTWILDPLDGTARYLRGEASWGTHVSLVDGGRVALGLISRPVLGRALMAAHGHGAHLVPGRSTGATALRVSSVSRTDDARVVGLLEPGGETLNRLVRTIDVDNENCFAVEEVASGRAEVLLDDAGKMWDQAPAMIIIREAGGRFSDVRGRDSIDPGYGVYSNGALHPWALHLATGVGDADISA